ncbi:MAG TPA: DUF6134 family protein [Gemmatimonadaceae bacterium]|nr:DUF6134 family protein [Gemmatimonadaceae bacterium]
MNALRTACLAISLLPAVTVAQTSAVVDEGTFTVSRAGAPLGRESFRIIRAPGPGGQAFQATGTSVLGDVKVTSRLATDSTGSPVSYESEVTQRGAMVQRLRGRGRPGRFSVLAQTRTGESAREYVIDNGALVIDEDVFIHFFFVGLAAHHPQVIVISPRSAQQARHQVQGRGQETLDIGGRTIAARRFTLTGGSGSRDVWVDDRGRLLKVAFAGDGLIALRDDPPR